MSLLHTATIGDLERLLALVAAFHAETGQQMSEAARRAALAPLLEDKTNGAAYLVGPARAPIGYVLVGFGWSLRAGGPEGAVDEIYIRPGVRGRGIGATVLGELPAILAARGVGVLHITAPRDDARARAFLERMHFRPGDDGIRMTRRL